MHLVAQRNDSKPKESKRQDSELNKDLSLMPTSLRNPLFFAVTLVASCSLTACRQTPFVAADTLTVPTATAQPANLATELVLTAEFTPYQDVDVMAKVAGYVKTIRVDIGDHVHEGDLLATLDVPELQDEMAKATAGLAAAHANIITAQAGVTRAQAGANMAHLSFQRIQDVATRQPGLVPRQEVDLSQAHDLEAAAQLVSAQSALQSAQQMQLLADSERSRAVAMLQYATIRAPFTGVVTKRYANTGSMIQAGIASETQSMPIVHLAENNLLRLTLPVPVSAVADIHDGDPVNVNITTLNRTFPGKITRFADSLQTSTRTMDTEVDVPNPDNTLVPGMYAEVRLHLATHPNVLSVPLDAVDGLGTTVQHVYAVRNGQLHLLPVTIGIQTPTRVEIRSGLTQGDQVVVGRHTGLADGQQVIARPASYEANGSPS
jgi:RND family efflux transporter MFP subunit